MKHIWHIQAPDMSLFLRKTHSVKSTPHSRPLFNQKHATKKCLFSNVSGSIFWHLWVHLFHFSFSWSSEMQFGVIYLEMQDSTQPYVALSVLEFRFCFFVMVENTQHQILLHCICQCLLGLVSSLFSWLMDAACLPCLAVKTSRLTVCIVSSLCAFYASNDIVSLSLSLSVWAGMSWSSEKWASESDFNTSSMTSQSVMFSPYNHIAKCTLMQFGTKSSDSVIQAPAVPGLSHIIALRGNRLKCSVEEDVSMNLQFKKVTKESLQQNKGHLPLVPCCTNHRNKCLYSSLSSPSDCIQIHLLEHTDKPVTTWKLNSNVHLELKQRLRKYDDVYSQFQILYYRVSTYSRIYLKRNKFRKLN